MNHLVVAPLQSACSSLSRQSLHRASCCSQPVSSRSPQSLSSQSSRRPARGHRQSSRFCTAALGTDAGFALGPLSSLQDLRPPVFDLAEGLEEPVQLLYIVTLLGFAAFGAYLTIRQVLVRRDLEEAAKVLGERIRSGDGNSEDCYELGVILLRKKLYTQATKNLDRARKAWTGPQNELAQVYNALGFAYLNMDKFPMAVQHYQKAVELQPGYVTAWNNLGDAFERSSKKEDALKAYEEALSYAPDNKIARARYDALRTKAVAP